MSELIQWVLGNYMALGGAILLVLIAFNGLLQALLAVLTIIPGDQGEGVLSKIISFMHKPIDALKKVFKPQV